MIACEKCKREIPVADFNIATDIAFCRNCNIQYKFSNLAATVNSRGFDYSNWPKNLTYSNNASEESITYKKLSPILLFLIPFCAMWSGGSMYGIYVKPLLQHTLNIGSALFGIPFLIGTLIMLSVITFLLFGKFKLSINNQGSYFGWSIFGIIRKKYFDPNKISSVLLKDSSFSRNNTPQKEIIIKFKDGAEIKFGAMLNAEEKNKLAEFLATKKIG